MGRAPKWSLLGLIAVLVFGIAIGVRPRSSAEAHAVLERSNPSQGAKIALDAKPDKVETWFSEAIERKLTKLQVFDTTGTSVATGDTLFSDTDEFYAAVALSPTLGPGVYTIGFENVSKVDGHAWTGSISFIVLNADGSVPSGTAYQPEQNNQGYLPGIGDIVLRWFAIIASVIIAGAAAFYLFVVRPAADFLKDDEVERIEDSGMAISADLIIIAIPVLILSVVGQAFLLADRLGGPGTLDDILFNTRTGQLWIARVALSAALFLLFLPALTSEQFRKGPTTRLIMAVALVGGSGLLMTYSLNSHAAQGGGEFWAVASDFVHFLATAAWLGALIELPLLFWWTRSKLSDEKRLLYIANVLDRFAWLAVISVTLLIGTGVFNGFVQLPTKEALWETTYGRVLMAKLALILPLLGIAGLNAVFISPRLSDAIDALHEEDEAEQAATPQERTRFQRQLDRLQAVLPKTAAIELFLGAAVLVSVAVLTQSTTAKGQIREEAGRPHGEYTATDQAGDLNTELHIEPFGIGLSTFTVTMTPAQGGEVGEVLGVRLRARFDDPKAPIGSGSSGTDQDLEATDDPAVWSTETALLTQPGDWTVEARIQRRGEDDVTARYNVLRVGGVLADTNEPSGLFDLPFTYVDWNIVAGGAMVAFGVGLYLIYRNRPNTWQRSTGWSVAAASTVSLIAAATLLFGVHSHAKIVDVPPPTAESVQRGQAIFTANCVVCHGVDGRGNNGRAADLTQHVPYHSDETLFVWISEGIPVDSETKRMPAWKDILTPDQRKDVVNFLRVQFGDLDFTPVVPQDTTPGSTTQPATP